MQVSDREFKRVAKQIGGRIQQLRKAAGMTQAELEEETGLSDIGVHERGEKNPTLFTLLRFARNLEVDLKDLVDIEEKSAGKEIRLELLGLLSGQDLDVQRKALELVRVLVG